MGIVVGRWVGRHIDLRSKGMQSGLRMRSKMLHNMRNFLIDKHSFVEVETPTLFGKALPELEETKDFSVTTQDGSEFSSLVQSQVQLNQLLMAGGFDRCFQFARSYRDEPVTADRQPEFTQLCMEVSFAEREGILELVESLLGCTYPMIQPPFQRMTFKEVLQTYGSATPDVSYDFKFHNLTELVSIPHEAADFGAFALVYPKKLSFFITKCKEQIAQVRSQHPRAKLAENVQIIGLAEKTAKEVMNMNANSYCFVAFGDHDDACYCLGKIRQLIVNQCKATNVAETSPAKPIWVCEAPLLAEDAAGRLRCAQHHPYTAPHPDDLHLLDTAPTKVRSLGYTLLYNGRSLGTGSVRMHRADTFSKVMSLLRVEAGACAASLRVLRSGCPPHAGIALGVDRLVALACNAPSIREVMAFPRAPHEEPPTTDSLLEDTKEEPRAKIRKTS